MVARFSAGAIAAIGLAQVDPFRTAQTDKPSEVQALVRAAQSTGVAVGEILCHIDTFLGHDTRTVTCGIEGNQQLYQGMLATWFTDHTFVQKKVTVEQPVTDGMMATWGIAVMAVYGYKDIARVEFTVEGKPAIWEQTAAAQSVLAGTYSYPKADEYPPPVRVDELLCKVSEFLTSLKVGEPVPPTYVVTCGMAGSQPKYSGNIAIWWHTFAQRIAEKNTPPPPPQQLSTPVNASRVQHVTVEHDVIGASFSHWGVTAFGIQSNERRAFDRMNFYLDSEVQTWTVDTEPQQTTQSFWCRIPLVCRHKKAYLRN